MYGRRYSENNEYGRRYEKEYRDDGEYRDSGYGRGFNRDEHMCGDYHGRMNGSRGCHNGEHRCRHEHSHECHGRY